MRLANVRAGDIVQVDVKGRRFYALAEADGAGARELPVRPITPGITYRRATSRQVIAHWRKSRSYTQAPNPQETPGNAH